MPLVSAYERRQKRDGQPGSRRATTNSRSSGFFFPCVCFVFFHCISFGTFCSRFRVTLFSKPFFRSVASQLLYVLFIASLWGMVQMTQLFSVAKSTTLVNVAHGVVSDACMHTYAAVTVRRPKYSENMGCEMDGFCGSSHICKLCVIPQSRVLLRGALYGLIP